MNCRKHNTTFHQDLRTFQRKALKTLITLKLVCFVFCLNVLEIFANSVGSVSELGKYCLAKLFYGRPRQMICPVSIQSRATIGPPAKRRSDGVLLAG